MQGYCDATSGGGSWLVIQRRIQKYSTDFHKKWDGFGDLNKEFWYGLRPIRCLTNTGMCQDGWMDGTTTVTTSTITMIDQVDFLCLIPLWDILNLAL